MWVCKKCGGDRIMETRYDIQRESLVLTFEGVEHIKHNYTSEGSIFECNGCGERAETFEEIMKEV